MPKYAEKLTELLGLARPEIAALCVLLLRGPQTVGEIRGRTGRLHEFATLEEAEATLQTLESRTPPLAVKLPRQAGCKESRFAHLLSGDVTPEPEVRTPRLDPVTLSVQAENERLLRLETELSAARQEIAELRQQFAEFRKQFE